MVAGATTAIFPYVSWSGDEARQTVEPFVFFFFSLRQINMESRRYDGKLDNFLLQSLSEDEYERIATSELCVVVCPEEKPAHKHVIVGHQHLYMTQFPPKNLKIAVHLEDVTSIRMVS